MSYTLTLTNGTLLETLADGSVDTTTTSLGLIGRNYAGYGQYLNENFIHLVENFSSSSDTNGRPTNSSLANPLKGQIWYDSTNSVLKVYNGTAWKELTNSNPASSAPANAQLGDFWYDNTHSLLNVYNGSSWITIGPAIPPGVAVTTIESNSILDPVSAVHTVGNIMVNNRLTAIVSSDASAFTPANPSLAGGFSTIVPGFNIINNAVVGGTITANGAVIVGSATLNGLPIATTNSSGVASFTAINSTPIGNAVPSTGSFTTLTATTLTATTLTANTLQSGTGNLSISTNLTPSANLSYNLGSSTAWFNNIYGTAIHAQYADLAERFAADQPYSAGTVVELGGAAEITATSQDLSENVFGVISTSAAYLMNSGAGTNDTHPPVAVQGRVPVRVVGVIRKGDRLVSAGNGLARAGARNEITAWNVIGRALENKTDTGEGIIEAVVKLNS